MLWAMSGTQKEKAVLAATEPDAVRALEFRAALHPDDVESTRALAQAYLDARQPGLAIVLVEGSVPSVHDDVRVQHVYARALVDEGRNDEALAVESGVVSRCHSVVDGTSRSAGCDPVLLASAMRRTDILRELVSLGVRGRSGPSGDEPTRLSRMLRERRAWWHSSPSCLLSGGARPGDFPPDGARSTAPSHEPFSSPGASPARFTLRQQVPWTTRRKTEPFRVAMVTAVVAATGCAQLPFAQSSHDPPVRPASMQAQEDIELLFTPSVGLASPGDAVVRVVGPQMTCSGTLIADDLVLTAHHCVVERTVSGELTAKPLRPSSIQVELGGDYLPWGNVGLSAILAPTCGETGGRGDVAVLVLERKLVGMATLALREGAPRPGEAVYARGFGRCALSPEGIRRREREGGPISSVTQGAFEVKASVCPGDSGGPVLDVRTREVVGVVSLSAMDYDEGTRGRSVFARVDEMPKLVAYARLVADGADPSDIPPLGCE